MPVVYSVGNFVFGTPGQWPTYGVPGLGLTLNLELGGPQPRVSVRCLVTDNRAVGFQPRPCTLAEAQGFLPTLHAGLTVQGDMGTVPCAGCFSRPRTTGLQAVPR